MDAQTFDRILRQLYNRRLFRRVTVGLVSGTKFTVDHPEALAFSGGTAIYITPDGTPWWFNDEDVEYLKHANGVRARRR